MKKKKVNVRKYLHFTMTIRYSFLSGFVSLPWPLKLNPCAQVFENILFSMLFVVLTAQSPPTVFRALNCNDNVHQSSKFKCNKIFDTTDTR